MHQELSSSNYVLSAEAFLKEEFWSELILEGTRKDVLHLHCFIASI
jgi:hypothetical protein